MKPLTETQRIAKFLAKWRTLTEAEKLALLAKLDRLDVKEDA
ncbi:hypothetical protein [Phyllobacterium leguminum]|uniref:Uncharacterized protein n=1 Tax=Phyllobacterium leguminum TaxID=314237 RepID=A0A318T2B0_9HYPH|nr:hypothetical protein [Phyllobacterium leguminum]PYE88759.1 hypothetical protein C7477_106132 [Phyllobacterium leguminum]